MSSFEKLKRLEHFGPPSNYHDMYQLQDVFPQILAVVEAAENIKSQSVGWGPKDDLDAALSALNEALKC